MCVGISSFLDQKDGLCSNKHIGVESAGSVVDQELDKFARFVCENCLGTLVFAKDKKIADLEQHVRVFRKELLGT